MNHQEMLQELDRLKAAKKSQKEEESDRQAAKVKAEQRDWAEADQQDKDKVLAENEALKTKNRNQVMMQLNLDIATKEKSLAGKTRKLQTPKVLIQDQATQASKEEWRSLGAIELRLQQENTGFSEFLMKFGGKKFSIMALLMTQFVGIFYVWAALGLDAMGSTWLTLIVAVIAMGSIDILGYFAVAGSLASFENFMEGKRYHRMLEAVFAAGFFIGLLSFMANVISRVMEAGI